MTSGGNNFKDFPDNHMTKFRVFVDREFLSPPLKFLWSICASFHPNRMYAPCRHNGQSDK